MAISILNWAIAKTILERDRPDADPDDINRFSVMAALVPGVGGLIVPFLIENNLPRKELTKQEIEGQIKEAEFQIARLTTQVEELKAKQQELNEPSPTPVEPPR
jgi:hypothetical protein